MVALVNEETTITKQIKPNVDFGVEGHHAAVPEGKPLGAEIRTN